MCWMLIMRKDNSPYDAGDIISVWDDLPANETPDTGRSPHKDDDYGSMHSVIHVKGLSAAAAQQYFGQQFDSNGIGYEDFDNPFRLPAIKPRMWHVDIEGKVPVGEKEFLKGVKLLAFEDRYDSVLMKPKENAFDMEMTKAKFEGYLTQKPVPEGMVIP